MKIKYLLFVFLFFIPCFVKAETLNYTYQPIDSSFSLDFFNDKVKNSSYFQNYIQDYPKYICAYYKNSDEYICFFGKLDDFDNSYLYSSNYSGVNRYYYSLTQLESKSRKQLVYSPSYTKYYVSEMYNDDIWYSTDIRILWYDFVEPYYLFNSIVHVVDSNIFVSTPISFTTEIDGFKYSCVANESNLFDIENSCRPALVGSDKTNYDLSKKIVGSLPVEFEFIYSIFSAFIAIIKFLCIIAPIILVIKLIGGGL